MRPHMSHKTRSQNSRKVRLPIQQVPLTSQSNHLCAFSPKECWRLNSHHRLLKQLLQRQLRPGVPICFRADCLCPRLCRRFCQRIWVRRRVHMHPLHLLMELLCPKQNQREPSFGLRWSLSLHQTRRRLSLQRHNLQQKIHHSRLQQQQTQWLQDRHLSLQQHTLRLQDHLTLPPCTPRPECRPTLQLRMLWEQYHLTTLKQLKLQQVPHPTLHRHTLQQEDCHSRLRRYSPQREDRHHPLPELALQ
mmetsp:Transcript_75268/g.220677  ORF Transcript_75268/g.220677 Transcript_75268/m.220677 type:complete len:247 (-) Transcript_75268:1678-2418(-)